MKRTFVLELWVIAAIFALSGCKPKQTTLMGQASIVTELAENAKLGGVEILLVEKSQVADFLQKKLPGIESEIESRQQQVTNAEQKLAAMLKEGTNVQAELVELTRNPPYRTNVNYLKMKSQLAAASQLKDTYQQQYDALNAEVTNAERSGMDADQLNALLARGAAARRSLDMENNEKRSLQTKLDAIESGVASEQMQMFEDIEFRGKTAKFDADTAERALGNTPTAEDYFGDFLPIAARKILTDADGQFTLSYPSTKAFTIFVHAQRLVFGETESYYWLVDAPTGAKTAQITLSNSNLVFADPDGYFKVKPKRPSLGPPPTKPDE